MRHVHEFHTRLSKYQLRHIESSDYLTLADSLPMNSLIHQNAALYLQASLQRYRLQQRNKAFYFLPIPKASFIANSMAQAQTPNSTASFLFSFLGLAAMVAMWKF